MGTDKSSLNDKVAVVTGASRPGGIGRAICRQLAAAGAVVVVSDLGPRATGDGPFQAPAAGELDGAVAEIEAAGGRAIAVPCDVTDPGDVDALVEAAVSKFGRLDIFVNNAGIAIESVELVEVSTPGFRKTLDVNLIGTFHGIRAAARQMIRQGAGGRIINTASQAGKSGWPMLSAYSASKFGVIGLTQVAAKELGRHGITVNAVCPGTVDTELSNSPDGIWQMYARMYGTTPEQVRQDTIAQIPLGRLQTPDDVADLVAFLASEAGGYITGEAINTTGGQEMH
ncbi:SDR family NAD(P)-dependent oxidoreductase [Microbispora sp. H10836]|uniref:SDR family NAD(P)-dependent oxidoreductase n=1 Tax=Microbispora sp. H10836 TaxID=2729106 RepID=UPI0014729E1D|nr:SDR family NAD(P)-dependent oxidoreductase [Microbispora sp. H10836]